MKTTIILLYVMMFIITLSVLICVYVSTRLYTITKNKKDKAVSLLLVVILNLILSVAISFACVLTILQQNTEKKTPVPQEGKPTEQTAPVPKRLENMIASPDIRLITTQINDKR